MFPLSFCSVQLRSLSMARTSANRVFSLVPTTWRLARPSCTYGTHFPFLSLPSHVSLSLFNFWSVHLACFSRLPSFSPSPSLHSQHTNQTTQHLMTVCQRTLRRRKGSTSCNNRLLPTRRGPLACCRQRPCRPWTRPYGAHGPTMYSASCCVARPRRQSAARGRRRSIWM